MQMYIYIHIYINIHIYIYICLCMYIYTYIYCSRQYLNVCNYRRHTGELVEDDSQALARSHIYANTLYIYICIYMCLYIYIYIYILYIYRSMRYLNVCNARRHTGKLVEDDPQALARSHIYAYTFNIYIYILYNIYKDLGVTSMYATIGDKSANL